MLGRVIIPVNRSSQVNDNIPCRPLFRQSMFLFWAALFWTLNGVHALSQVRSSRLGYITPVVDLTHTESPSGVDLQVTIASDGHLSNLERRWYVQADPNSAKALHKQYRPSQDSSSDSLALYSYLTRNTSSIEVPQDTLQFRLTLSTPDDDHWYGLEDENGDLDETLVVLRGKSYRSVQSIRNGREFSNYKPVGWARIVMSNHSAPPQFLGSWLVDDETGLGTPRTTWHLTTVEHLLALLDEAEQNDLLDSNWDLHQPVVWREFDLQSDSALSHMEEFAADNFDYLRQLENERKNLFARDSDYNGNPVTGVNLYETIGDSSGCPDRRMVSLVGVAADCNFLGKFNSSQSARSYILDTVTQASRFYEESFNISLGLKSIVMANSSDCSVHSDLEWNYACDSGDNSTLSSRLGAISTWRERTRPNDGMATWTLFTNCAQGGVVGLAWMGLVCQTGGTSVVASSLVDTHVLAHEIGHSFGAVHDCDSSACTAGDDRTSNCCPNGNSTCATGGEFLMNPSSSSSQDMFSPCTQGNVCNNIGRRSINTTCLLPNSGRITLISENVCGNGIVEEGEECDCGGPEGCKGNTCCDPLTCKFTTGSQCDDLNDHCCNNCKFASSSTVCRDSTGPCDFTEYCPGNSTECPAIRIKKDGTSCTLSSNNATNLQCISGHCTSRDLQCVTLMGNRTRSFSGNALNVVRACSDDSSCQLSCVDPTYGNSMCFTTSQNFLDGTPCRGTGRCKSGTCIGGSTSIWGNTGSDGSDNGSSFYWWKYVVIVICSVFGASFFLWLVCVSARRGKHSPARLQASQPAQPFIQNHPHYPPPPPPMRHDVYPPPPPRYAPGTYYPPPPNYEPSYEHPYEPAAQSGSSASVFEAPTYPPPASARQYKPDSPDPERRS